MPLKGKRKIKKFPNIHISVLSCVQVRYILFETH